MVGERRARVFLSDWHFWVGVAYFGLAAVVLALYILFGRTAREEASRAAAAKAASTAQVAQCFGGVKNAPVIAGFIRSHEAIIENGLIANRAAIAASPGDPLNAIRQRSIDRLTAAKANADELRRLIKGTTPTKRACTVLAHKLGVDPSRYTPTSS